MPVTLADRYLPHWQFRERHVRLVDAPAAAVMAAARAYRPEEDAVFRRMIALREAPMRLASVLSGGRYPARGRTFGMQDFVLLGEVPAREVAYGLVGRFWQASYGLVALEDGAGFLQRRETGEAKLLLDFRIEDCDGRSRLVTETRVYCPDAASRRRLAPYWYLIRPVSGWLRRRMLAAIARAAQSRPGR